MCRDMKEESGQGDELGLGVDIYTQPCVKLIASENPLYCTGSLAWGSVITLEWVGWGEAREEADSLHCTAETSVM